MTDAQHAIQVVAHRGASQDAPEHTLAAYRKAIEEGADALECDVRLTADGHLVCVHDRRINRTSNGRGAVSALELSELATLDFGSWKRRERSADAPGWEERPDWYDADRADDISVLTLERLLELVADSGRRIELAIETKHPTRWAGQVEQRLLATLRRFGLDAPPPARGGSNGAYGETGGFAGGAAGGFTGGFTGGFAGGGAGGNAGGGGVREGEGTGGTGVDGGVGTHKEAGVHEETGVYRKNGISGINSAYGLKSAFTVPAGGQEGARGGRAEPGVHETWPVRIMSFSARSLQRVRIASPYMPTVYLMQFVSPRHREGRLPAGVHIAGPSMRIVRGHPGYVAKLKKAGHKVHVWTVNEEADVDLCVSLGVDAIITNRPKQVLRRLGRA